MRVLPALCLVVVACGPSGRADGDNGGSNAHADGNNGCALACSADSHSVVDCNGVLVTPCTGADACDQNSHTCGDACTGAAANHHSVGCEYYATDMDSEQPSYCFAAFVANTWNTPAHITVDYGGVDMPVAAFTRLPVGAGPSLTYSPYDATAGVPAGEVAVLFLGGDAGGAPNCPVASAVAGASKTGTGISSSFHVKTDVPVVAYQINPYGGGSVAVTAASLLLPASVWDTDYVAVNVSEQSTAGGGSPSMNIIAQQDGTVVTLTPKAAVLGNGGIPSGAANAPLMFTLNKGQNAQITQSAELTGSIVTASAPIGMMAGQPCMNMPASVSYCDHGEQMVPPVHALGSRYVGVMYRPRTASETTTFWRLIGAADGTQLTYSSNVGGPPVINKGEVVRFETGTPFIVQSQDANHPFALFTYMTGSAYSAGDGYGDPDFVVSVPPEQYLSDYVFFADPTYPETNLVVIRAKGSDNAFHDVNLDCAGALTGWTDIGDFQWTRTDLMRHNFAPVGQCSTGRHGIKSDARFGLWVWGWGTPETTDFTANVSYGYPGGMNVAPINSVVIE